MLSRNEWPHKYWKHATVKSHSEQFYIPCCSSLLPCTYQVHVTFHGGREAVRLFIAGCRCSCAILQVVGVYKHRSKVNLILQQAPPGNAILRGGGRVSDWRFWRQGRGLPSFQQPPGQLPRQECCQPTVVVCCCDLSCSADT